MKTKYINQIITMMLLLFVSCSLKLSTQEISAELKKTINVDLISYENDLKVDSVVLVQESENIYTGDIIILETGGNTKSFDIKVIYDGEMFKWESPKFKQYLLSIDVKKSINEYLLDEYLSDDVRKSIKEYFTLEEIPEFKLEAKTLILFQESSNIYSGVLTITDGEGYSENLDVKVINDGENTKWEIPNIDEQLENYIIKMLEIISTKSN